MTKRHCVWHMAHRVYIHDYLTLGTQQSARKQRCSVGCQFAAYQIILMIIIEFPLLLTL